MQLIVIGVANKMQWLRLLALPKQFKAQCSRFFNNLLYLGIALMPRSGDLAIFILTTTTDDR